VVSVQRLSARAHLDESPQALTHAQAEAATGDESWQQWVDEYNRGDALIIQLDLKIELGGEQSDELERSVGGFFVEVDLHPAKVEHQIAELASGELIAMAERPESVVGGIDPDELGDMHVHVELDNELRDVLSRIAPE
jgi:hypothetical protein